MFNLYYILLVSLVGAFVINLSIGCIRSQSKPIPKLRAGVATFTGPSYGGQVLFTPTSHRQLEVTGKITGLPASTLLSVHIHSKGNLGDACGAAGEHWNPFDKNDGDLVSKVRRGRDIGNIATDANGDMSLNLIINSDERDPTHGFIGLALIVHSGPGNMARVEDKGVKITKIAGTRLTCAVIGLQEPPIV